MGYTGLDRAAGVAMGMIGDRIKELVLSVPVGRVTSYGRVAAMAGLPNGARTVARVLHSCAAADGLPWWRIVRSDGSIALRRGGGFEAQLAALAAEGVEADGQGRVDMARYGWDGRRVDRQPG